MSSKDPQLREGSCVPCRRRSWLLSELSALLDYHRGRPERLRELLALPDERLIDALAGSRKQLLRAMHRTFHQDSGSYPVALDTLCRHRRLYPVALEMRRSSAALYIGGDSAQLSGAMKRPLVAILGSRRPSDYGTRMARSLARGLAASGVTVLSELQLGIAAAAHRGALELRAATVAVTGDGLDFAHNARRGLYDEIVGTGCVLSELEPKSSGRGWGSTSCWDMLCALASVFVVIEAEEASRETDAAHRAIAQGVRVAAMPGRVESPLAAGPHALLLKGANLITGPQDVLELLYEGEASSVAEPHRLGLGTGLPEHLRAILSHVLSGDDTPQTILVGNPSAVDGLAALSELELAGLVLRTPDGRYIPADGAPSSSSLRRPPEPEG